MYSNERPSGCRGASAIDLAIVILWVCVVLGAIGIVSGWFDRIDPIEAAWAAPAGSALLLRTGSGTLSSYDVDTLERPLATLADIEGLELVAWADDRTLVARRGDQIVVLGIDDLQVRPWFEGASRKLVLGIDGRTIVAADVERPESPLPTLALSNWQVGERQPPEQGAGDLPFVRLLAPAGVTPPGVALRIEDGRLTLQHPRLAGATQLALPRPNQLAAGSVLLLALALLLLRRLRSWRHRHRLEPTRER